jgi:hypothetical protein
LDWIGIERLLIVTTSNYGAVSNSHTQKFTKARTMPSQSAVSSQEEVPLLPGSRPCGLATISHQPPTFLTAVSGLSLDSDSLVLKFKVTLRLTVSQSVSLHVEPHLVLMTRNLLLFHSYGLILWGALSEERTGLSFIYAAGPRQRSLSRVRVPWDS